MENNQYKKSKGQNRQNKPKNSSVNRLTRNNAPVNGNEIDLLALAKVLLKHAWAIALTAILGAALFIGYAKFFIAPTYSASVMMYVNNSSISVGNTSVNLSDLSAAQSLVDTYLVILDTRSTLEDVIDESGLNYSYKQVSSMISASAVNSTEIFRVTVTCTNAEDAAVLANTIADILPDKISSIVDGSSCRVVEHAIVNHNKVAPSVSRYAMIGFLLGFVLMCGIFVIRELMDDKIKDEEYLLAAYNVPMLGVIPDLKEKSHKSGGYYSYEYARKNR